MRGRGKRAMLTGKAAGQLEENGNGAPGKRESGIGESEDADRGMKVEKGNRCFGFLSCLDCSCSEPLPEAFTSIARMYLWAEARR